MPQTDVVIYQEADGHVPLLDWLDGLPDKARAKCLVRIERLAELGSELRRPEADYLRDGIYELRIGFQGKNYRILYCFCGQRAALLTHGLVKRRRVPPKEIDLAIRRKRRFESSPDAHTYRG